MTRALAAAPALAAALATTAAACAREHDVRIELGSDDGTLGLGFRCVDAQGTPLAARALVGGRLEFRIVLDLIGVGDTVPGCRGEEILRACPRAEDCPTLVVSADGRRACVEVTVAPPLDQASITRQVADALRGLELTPDAPDRPVIVRAVATTERCDERLVAPAGDTYASLDPDAAIGCAYSCPLQLDTVEGAIALYLDALDERCETQVRACAAFPARGP
ncbi:MAG TPA: hypothetical protein VNO30_38180 [Kofleriaceae bacterium]|nr:hypothetical protein [Kofleriaceae bacterium]